MRTILQAAFAIAILAGSAFGQTTKPAPTTGTATAPSEAELGPYAPMVAAMKLTPDQQEQIAAALKQGDQAKREFLEKARKDWSKAMEGAGDPDPAVAQEARKRVDELNRKFEELSAAWTAKAMAALTPRQALEWEEQQVTETVVEHVAPVRVEHGVEGIQARRLPLTDAQMKVIREDCAAAAKEIQGWPNPYDAAKRDRAIKALIKKVSDDLATKGIAPAGPEDK